MSLSTSRRRDAVVGLLAAAALALVLVLAPAARAADCEDQATTRPFKPWADLAQYMLVPNGTVEDGAHWDLDDGAVRSAGNETFYVHDGEDATSLKLPAGASATTAPICVGLEHPTLRLFARNSGSQLSLLLVEVLFEDATGRQRSLAIGAYTGTSTWQPTVPLAVVANLFSALPGENIDVAFRFTPLGGAGRWAIDDVYVDPFRHG